MLVSWAELCPSPESYVEALDPKTQNVTLFGERVFKVVTTLE